MKKAGKIKQMEFDWGAALTGAQGALPHAVPRHAEREEMLQRGEKLRRDLKARLRCPVDLTVTDNSSSIMSMKRTDGGGVRLRLHHMFLEAPEPVRAALAKWVQHPRAKRSGDILDVFIRERRHLIRSTAARRTRICTQGEYYDLQRLYDEVNRAYFDGKIHVPITWGRMPAPGRRQSIRFGSYAPEERLIRIHPLLDAPHVPRFFVRYIVFHEMLHALLGIAEGPTGRRSVHPPEFKTIEKGYPDYEKAMAWMEDPRNMGRILKG